MAYLLAIDWTTVDDTVVGLSQDWVKGFIHQNIGIVGAKSIANNVLHPQLRIWFLSCFFKQGRSITAGFAEKR